MSDQNPEVPGQPDPAAAAERPPRPLAVEQRPGGGHRGRGGGPGHRGGPAAPCRPRRVDAGAVPPPPPPGYAAPAAAMVPVFPNGKPMLDAAGNPVSDKSRLAAALLCFFFGGLGIHRFYVGKIGTGIAIILTLRRLLRDLAAHRPHHHPARLLPGQARQGAAELVAPAAREGPARAGRPLRHVGAGRPACRSRGRPPRACQSSSIGGAILR